MLSAIRSTAALGQPGGGQSTAGLEAQLDQCKKQLSQQESCPSSKTTQGQARLAALTEQVSTIQKRIDAVRSGQGNKAVAATPSTTAGRGSTCSPERGRGGGLTEPVESLAYPRRREPPCPIPCPTCWPPPSMRGPA
jgi:hypothetical protein